MKMFFFSFQPLTAMTTCFRLVIAPNIETAREMILDPKNDSLDIYLRQQMEQMNSYLGCKTLTDALKVYFPFQAEIPIEEGMILICKQGQTNLAARNTRLQTA